MCVVSSTHKATTLDDEKGYASQTKSGGRLLSLRRTITAGSAVLRLWVLIKHGTVLLAPLLRAMKGANYSDLYANMIGHAESLAANGGAGDESMAGPCFIVVTRLGAMFGHSFVETELWVSDGDGSMDTTTCNATHGSPPTDVQPTCPSVDVSKRWIDRSAYVGQHPVR